MAYVSGDICTIGELEDLIAKAKAAGLTRENVVVMRVSHGTDGYRPLSRAWVGQYVASTTWNGEVGIDELTPEHAAAGYDWDDLAVDSNVPALILHAIA